jgi:hypothetical protein
LEKRRQILQQAVITQGTSDRKIDVLRERSKAALKSVEEKEALLADLQVGVT